MRPVQYIWANRGLGMTPGKLAAQVAHASVLSFKDSKTTLSDEWLDSGHYTKLVMLANDHLHMLSIERYLRDRGYRTYMVIDEGHTEIEAHTPTALALEIVDKDKQRVQQHLGDFKLYKEKEPEPIVKQYRVPNQTGVLNLCEGGMDTKPGPWWKPSSWS